MSAVDTSISYSSAVFVLIFAAGLAIDLLNKHYIIQLSGIAFFFTYFYFRCASLLRNGIPIGDALFCETLLIASAGISACFLSMVLGFWLFPLFRDRFRR